MIVRAPLASLFVRKAQPQIRLARLIAERDKVLALFVAGSDHQAISSLLFGALDRQPGRKCPELLTVE